MPTKLIGIISQYALMSALALAARIQHAHVSNQHVAHLELIQPSVSVKLRGKRSMNPGAQTLPACLPPGTGCVLGGTPGRSISVASCVKRRVSIVPRRVMKTR